MKKTNWNAYLEHSAETDLNRNSEKPHTKERWYALWRASRSRHLLDVCSFCFWFFFYPAIADANHARRHSFALDKGERKSWPIRTKIYIIFLRLILAEKKNISAIQTRSSLLVVSRMPSLLILCAYMLCDGITVFRIDLYPGQDSGFSFCARV